MELRKLKRSFIGIMLGVMVAGSVPAFSGTLPPEALTADSPGADLVEKVGHAVVNIDVEGTVTRTVNQGLPNDPFFREFFGDMFREYSAAFP